MAEGETADPDVLYVSGLVAAIFCSPTWVSPIATFVDENCGVFEDQEENKLEYTLVHNAFKQLVDDLLEAHLQELNVTQEQFVRFCQYGLAGENAYHKELVEQLLSVDDFLVFKAMMVKRNMQLYQQALELFGLTVATPSAPPQPSGADAEQLRMEAEAAELEAERMELQRKCVEAELQLAMALSMQLQKRLQLMEALSEILEALSLSDEFTDDARAAQAGIEALLVQPLFVVTAPEAPDEMEVEAQQAEQQRQRAQQAVQVSRQQAQERAGPSEEERRARAEHLKQQRDALKEKRRREREGELADHRAAHGETAAVVAASGVMAGTDGAGQRLAAELSGAAPPPPPGPSAQDTAAAEMRRALARQLKEHITGSSGN